MASTTPQIITIDLIRELRLRGMDLEAKRLLKAHYEDVKKAGRNAFNEVMQKDRRIKSRYGLCHVDSCLNKVVEGKQSCEYHLEKMRRRYKENAESKEKRE